MALAAASLAACGSSAHKNLDGGPDAADAAQEHATDVAVGDAVGDTAADAHDAPAGDLADAMPSDATDAGPTCTPACTAGKACVNGACVNAPVVLARAPGCGTARLAVTGGRVYWTESATGFVKSVPIGAASTTPTVIAQGQLMPGPIAADSRGICWSNLGERSIMMAPLVAADAGTGDAGAPVQLLDAAAAVNGLIVNLNQVYFSAGPSAWKVTRTAGALGATPLATFATCRASRPAALALDGDYLYQTDYTLQFITRERIDGTQASNDPCAADPTTAPKVNVPTTISHSQGELLFDAIAVWNGEVYWADNATISAKAVDGTTATTSRQVTLSAGGNVITGFVVDTGSVYFGESGDFQGGPTANTIQVAPIVPGEAGADDAKVIAEGQPGAASFVADASHIYWSTHTPSATAGAADDCAIVSLAE
jgi:hypothetical protein